MKSLENFIAAVIAACVLVLLPAALADSHYAGCLGVTGRGSVDRLAAQIARERELTAFTYNQHADELYLCGFGGGLEVSYYTFEAAADGSGRRRYATTWEEVREGLLADGRYSFPENAYVCVTARAGNAPLLEAFLRTRTDYSVSEYIERGSR